MSAVREKPAAPASEPPGGRSRWRERLGRVSAAEWLGWGGVALGLLAFYLAILGRGMLPVLLAAALIGLLLLVTFDLDRPTRGLIRIPATPLTSLRASMELPPAAAAPSQAAAAQAMKTKQNGSP